MKTIVFYYLAGLISFMLYRFGYWRGKRRGLQLGEKIGYNKRKTLEHGMSYGSGVRH